MYNVLALIPEGSGFTLERAVAHFAGLTFSKFRSGKCVYHRHPLRAELAQSEGKREPSGFRVFYGDWGVVAWLESGRAVRGESEEMAELDDLPAPTEVIAGCTRRLSVWSDEDPAFGWTDDFTEYTEELRGRFGMFIHDCVNGCWWT
jgi:hypothetical protein